MTSKLTKLENEIMRMLLAGEHPLIEILRNQFASCTVAKREFSGVGFFTTFVVAENAPRLPNKDSFYFGDVSAVIPPLKNGAGFVLRVNEGVLDYLEGYTYDEPWPDHTDDFTLQYHRTPRDINAVLWKQMKSELKP
jgi:hypothetical protein